MADVSYPMGVAADVYQAFVDAVDGRINAILDKIATSAFVSTAPMTVADLLVTFPASAANMGKYARVTDLYGSVDDVLRCRFDGVNYRWVPQRADFNVVSTASGAVPLIPLVTPPTIKTPTSLTGNISFQPSAANAYIGQRYRIAVTGGLGIYTATISGLIGSNLTLLGNSAKDIEYAASGWFSV